MPCCGQCGLKAEKGLEENKGVVSALEGDDPDGEAAGEPHISVCAHMCVHAHTCTHVLAQTDTLPDQPSQECCRTQPLTSFPADGGVGLSRKAHQARKSSRRRHPVSAFLPCHLRASKPGRYKLGEASWLCTLRDPWREAAAVSTGQEAARSRLESQLFLFPVGRDWAHYLMSQASVFSSVK